MGTTPDQFLRYHGSLAELEADCRGLAAALESGDDGYPLGAIRTSRTIRALEDAANIVCAFERMVAGLPVVAILLLKDPDATPVRDRCHS